MTLPAFQAAECGQSIWYDNISRDLLRSGELERLIRHAGVRGVTSNPSIFQKAMSTSQAYEEGFARLSGSGDAETVYEALAVEDIQAGADLLRELYDETNGADGYISLEVSPGLAADTEGTIAAAKRLWAAVDRPNLMIKIPATPEGMPAIRAVIGAGINVNVTLIFSQAAYDQVIDAYQSGLEDRIAAGGAVDRIHSVASFFVSRVDSAVDKRLGAVTGADAERAQSLRGKAAVANAKLAYALFEERFGGDRWAAIQSAGGNHQRPLWASTSTKDPSYPDTLYVDTLIGAHTVNTIPPATLDAFNDHGTVRADAVREGVDQARADLAAIDALGISLDAVCDELLDAGVASFAGAFDTLLAAVDTRRRAHAG